MSAVEEYNKAAKAQGEIHDELEFLRKAIRRGGGVVDLNSVVGTLLSVVTEQYTALTALLEVVRELMPEEKK